MTIIALLPLAHPIAIKAQKIMTKKPQKTLNCHRSCFQLLEENTNVGGILDSTQEVSSLTVLVTTTPLL
jgi:hypothetical protein